MSVLEIIADVYQGMHHWSEANNYVFITSTVFLIMFLSLQTYDFILPVNAE